MDQVEIRTARLDDAGALLNIYGYYVKNTAITFKYEVPSVDEFRSRMEGILKKYPYLVAVQNGRIVGYAYARAFVGRAAYDWSAEMSIYLDRGARKRGLGRALYEALEGALGRMGILNLYACIAYPGTQDEYLTANSAQFHAHMGFQKVGEFHQCGYKFGRWYHMIWMEKIIGEHQREQAAVKPFCETDGL